MSDPRMPDDRVAGTSAPASRPPMTGRLVFGLLVIFLGLLFLLEEFGIADASAVLRWWPVALLAYGLVKLTGIGGRQQATPGLIFTLIGGWFLLRELGVISYRFRDFWPLILIALGITMVTGGLRRRRGVAGSADPSSTVSAFAFWSGVDRKVVTPDFQGGDLTAIMGGHEIDLRSAKIAGASAVIDLFVIMGGVDLRVPDDWAVSSELLPVMGGVEDRTRPPAGEVRGHLVLRGFVMMGGVEVKN